MARSHRRRLLVLALVVVLPLLAAAAYFLWPYDAPAEDDLVLTAVLEDLATRKELGRRRDRLLVHPLSCPDVDMALVSALDEATWVQHLQIKLVRGDLARRNRRSFPLPALPVDPAIACVENVDRAKGHGFTVHFGEVREQTGLFQHVALSRPGHARAGALVVVTLTPSSHGVHALYFLTRSQGRWTVAWRRFIFYA